MLFIVLMFMSLVLLGSLPLPLVAGSCGLAFIERRISLLILFFIFYVCSCMLINYLYRTRCFKCPCVCIPHQNRSNQNLSMHCLELLQTIKRPKKKKWSLDERYAVCNTIISPIVISNSHSRRYWLAFP
jgi:hypothetical protein